MSVIRQLGPVIFNLTKVIKMRKGETSIMKVPYIEFTTCLTNKYKHVFSHGIDHGRENLYFDSHEERDNEYNEIVNILENYYKHK